MPDLSKRVNVALGELDAIFVRIEKDNLTLLMREDYDDHLGDLGFELGEFLIRRHQPCNVGEVMLLCPELRGHGLCYLIQRDAEEIHDDIEGFLDSVWMDDLHARADIPHQLDGEGLCKWITEHIPQEENAK